MIKAVASTDRWHAQDHYPREALFEAILRYVEEDLAKVSTSSP